jgi:hypothetical protein
MLFALKTCELTDRPGLWEQVHRLRCRVLAEEASRRDPERLSDVVGHRRAS